MKKKIVIVTTHPIQYQVPWFRELENTGLYELTVLFGILPDSSQQGVGFGKDFFWDIPLLEGYSWKVLENRSKNPGLEAFSGVDTPFINAELSALNPDVVIVTGWHSKMMLQATFAANRRRIPIVMRGDSNAMQSRPLYKRLIYRAFFRRFDAFLVVGSSNRQFYQDGGVPDSKLFDAPHFIDNNRFAKILKENGSKVSGLRNSLQIPHDSFCFVYAGKLIEKKNVGELLEGFLILHQKEQEHYANGNAMSHFLIIGEGELRDDLEQYARKKNLPVTFCGFVNQSDLPLYYAIGNCFLLGSNYGETWGLVVNEAMICGMPAIVSDRVGCGPDLIIEGETGYLYSYGNSTDLSKMMEKISNDKALAKTAGSAARERVENNFTLQASVSATAMAVGYVAG